MRSRVLPLTVLCLALFPAISLAQERGKVGLTMGFPAAAGLIWHATDRIAVRPEITFSQTTSKAEASPPTPSRRFGIFGEVGLGREHSERTRSFPEITVTTSVTSWSIRSAVGVILYIGS